MMYEATYRTEGIVRHYRGPGTMSAYSTIVCLVLQAGEDAEVCRG